ncbi:MAG: hypothetical protein FWD19_00615 [Defluviitaleaceae bacterium]|nr:hypothetical protein [Defluviitaleaceae bacterium]
MNAVANKMILVIVCLSVLIAAASFFVFASLAENENITILATIMGVNENSQTADTIPFAIGVSFAAALNVAKVLLMKRAVNNAVTRDELSAKMYLKGQYFLRLVITAVVLFVVGWLHANACNEAGNPQYVNFMGAFFGIFTFPVSTYSMRFFFRHELKDNPELWVKPAPDDTVQDAIDKLKAFGDEKDEE